MPVTEYRDKLGRRRLRGYKRVHKECRKVVPKRKFDLKTPQGLIKWYAYNSDTTHKDLARAAGIGKAYVDNMLCYPEKLKPHFIRAFVLEMGLTEKQVKRINDAYDKLLPMPK